MLGHRSGFAAYDWELRSIKLENAALRISVTIERREDGGLFVYSDDLPGFVLSHLDAEAVLADIEPALSVFVSHAVKHKVEVKPIVGLRESLIEGGILAPLADRRIERRDYAAIAA